MPDLKLAEDLAYANRILYDQGVFDAFGHISVRHDKDPSRFLLSRNMAPALVTPADIMEHDLQGQPVNPGNRRPYLERFIHAGIYRARPDVDLHRAQPFGLGDSIRRNRDESAADISYGRIFGRGHADL